MPQKEINSVSPRFVIVLLQELFHLLKVINFFTDRNSRRIQYLDDEGWINDLPFILEVTGHLNAINPLNAELNPIRHLLALVGARRIVHVRRIRVNRAL
jgi:hypothetical protein